MLYNVCMNCLSSSLEVETNLSREFRASFLTLEDRDKEKEKIKLLFFFLS